MSHDASPSLNHQHPGRPILSPNRKKPKAQSWRYGLSRISVSNTICASSRPRKAPPPKLLCHPPSGTPQKPSHNLSLVGDHQSSCAMGWSQFTYILGASRGECFQENTWEIAPVGNCAQQEGTKMTDQNPRLSGAFTAKNSSC